MIWQVKMYGDPPYKIPASDLRVEGFGTTLVATFLDENGVVAVFNSPESIVLIKDDPSNN